jgi:hypothetical protein
VRSCPALTGLTADTMKQLFTTAKKRLRHSIIDFNPSVADSIGTGEEFEAFLRSVQACCYNSEFRGARSQTAEPAISETIVSIPPTPYSAPMSRHPPGIRGADI